MDREVFKEKFGEELINPSYDIEKIHEIIDKSIKYMNKKGNVSARGNEPEGINNLIIVEEELFELGKEISKIIRGSKINYVGLIEEMADNCLGIMYLQKLFNISNSELQAAMMVKMNRLDEEMSGGEYK